MAKTRQQEYTLYEDLMVQDLNRLQCVPSSQVFILNPDRQWVYRHAHQLPIAQPFYAHHYDPIFHRHWAGADQAQRSLLMQHYENDIVY